MTVTANTQPHEAVDLDTMMVAFLREYGLPGTRERARHHIGRRVGAGLADDAVFWMRISNSLNGRLRGKGYVFSRMAVTTQRDMLRPMRIASSSCRPTPL